jgi:hypothetical protein
MLYKAHYPQPCRRQQVKNCFVQSYALDSRQLDKLPVPNSVMSGLFRLTADNLEESFRIPAESDKVTCPRDGMRACMAKLAAQT